MKTKKILIVEDNELNRRLFENLISQNYLFETASDGFEAIEKLKIEYFDLILLNLKIPMLEGITTINKIRKELKIDCPVIAISAYAEEFEVEKYIQLGFDDLIIKPIRPREFLEKINYCLGLRPKSEEQKTENEALVLDRKILSQLMKFNANDSIKQVYLDFITECDEICTFIENADLSRAKNEIAEKLHILKGNSGTLGANRIFCVSKKTEIAAKIENLNDLEKYIPILRKEIDFFVQIIKEETNFEL